MGPGFFSLQSRWVAADSHLTIDVGNSSLRALMNSCSAKFLRTTQGARWHTLTSSNGSADASIAVPGPTATRAAAMNGVAIDCSAARRSIPEVLRSAHIEGARGPLLRSRVGWGWKQSMRGSCKTSAKIANAGERMAGGLEGSEQSAPGPRFRTGFLLRFNGSNPTSGRDGPASIS